MKINLRTFSKALTNMQKQFTVNLLNSSGKINIVYGSKFIGKTMLVNFLFINTKKNTIYHTGCNPKLSIISNNHFFKILKKEECNYPIIILDEYYNKKLLTFLSKYEFNKLYIFTNDLNFTIENAVCFNLIDEYEKCKQNYFKNKVNFDYHFKNIREIYYILTNKKTSDLQQILTKLDAQRKISTVTSTKVKSQNKLYISELKFGENNDFIVTEKEL